MSKSQLGIVISSSAEAIVVLVESLETFEEHKANLQVGRYLQISEGNADLVIAIIRNLQGISGVIDDKVKWTFEIECQPLGTLIDGKTFSRGSSLLPVPTEPAFAVDKNVLDLIFAAGARFDYALAPLSMNKQINLMVESLSGILCVRHNRRQGAYYAKQSQKVRA